jgi:NAD(P)H-dependent FMN reductase
MNEKKNVFVIIGSASSNSANERLMDLFVRHTENAFQVSVFNDLKLLPHFDPDLSIENTPSEVLTFRKAVEKADGVVICTPEYVFSIPAGLKNALEWCVSTVVFTDKPVGLITASASGKKGHEELQLIMQTLGARFTEETTLLIPGIKGKVNEQGEITDDQVKSDFEGFTKIIIEFIS